MPITSINNIINNNFDKNIFLFGSEEFLIDDSLTKITNNLLSKKIQIVKLDSDEIEINYLLDLLNSFNMFEPQQCIICKNFENLFSSGKKNDANIKKLEEYIDNPNSNNKLIITSVNDKYSKELKVFPKNIDKIVNKFDSIQFPKVWPNRIPDWIKKRFEEKGVSISLDACNLILNLTSDNLREIDNQIDKILIFNSEKTKIEIEDIYNVTGNSRQNNTFELQKAVSQRNLNKSLQISENIYVNSKSELISIIPLLFNHFSTVFKLIELDMGSNKFEIAKKLGVPPFFMDDYILSSKNYNFLEIEKIFILLSETDLNLKYLNNNILVVIQLMLNKIIKR